MKTLKYFMLLLICILISACGPIVGQFMKSSEGLKNYTVVNGDLQDLKEVNNLLVVGPFEGKGTEQQTCVPGEECIYPYSMDLKFVTKYNDAKRFAYGLKQAELFDTELYLELHYDRLSETVKRLKTMSSPEIQKELELEKLPDMILFGVVKKRDNKIAPTRGVVVDVHYELEFYRPDSQESILIDVAVVELFKEDLKTIIQETKKRLIMGN